MTQRLGFGGSRRLAILLFVITVPPAMTLVWLGVRILQQDHELAIRHALERRQADLRTVVRSLEQSWGDIERALNDGAVPDGAVRLRISDHGIQAMPDGRALWLPARPALDSPGDDQFLAIERTEYRGDYANTVRCSSPPTRLLSRER
jgi:hypothetical protein